jgi:hypothetical protein
VSTHQGSLAHNMITRIIKSLQIIFLFLAVSILNAHMIIPHDHHQADSDLCSETSNPVSKTGSQHHPGMPGHCHAFNDLAFGKANSYLINKQIPVRDLIMGCIFETKGAERQLSATRVVKVFNCTVIKGLPGLSSLRAPPTFV